MVEDRFSSRTGNNAQSPIEVLKKFKLDMDQEGYVIRSYVALLVHVT